MVVVGIILYFFVLNKKITITFIDGSTTVETLKMKKGVKITLPDVDKEGYSFEGWYYNNKKVTENDTFSQNVTLVGNWLEIGVSIMTFTFDTVGGNEIEPMTVECDTEFNLPTPTKSGYKFLDWRDRNDIVISDETKLVCQDIALTANWEQITTTTKTTSTTTAEAKKEYTCPDGYTLDGTKCTMTKNASTKCEGTRVFKYENKCVTITYAARKDPDSTCGKTTVHTGGGHTEEVEGKLFKIGTNYCFFKEVTDTYESNQSNCTSRGHYWNSKNNTCYYYRGDANQFVTSTCNHLTNYAYITNPNDYEGVNGLNGGCYPLSNKTKYCASGFTLTGSKCVKTVDATLK